jgi:hypothetical protein
VNRYNFLAGKGGVRLVSVESFEEIAAEGARIREIQSLRAEFVGQCGRGARFVSGNYD